MGPHHDVDTGVEQSAENSLAVARPHATGQELYAQRSLAPKYALVVDREALEVPAQRRQVLFGEYFGGGHQGALSPAINRREQRRQGDDGLARTHVALQEPVHGQR